MKEEYSGFFYNRFAKGFYVSLIAINYPVFIAATSFTAPIDERIQVIAEHFLKYELFGISELALLMASLRVTIFPAILSSAAYLIMNAGQEIYARIEIRYYQVRKAREDHYYQMWQDLKQIIDDYIILNQKAGDYLRYIEDRSEYKKFRRFIEDPSKHREKKAFMDIDANLKNSMNKESLENAKSIDRAGLMAKYRDSHDTEE